MSESLSLNEEGEKVWQRLKRHLDWCDHFALCFIFNLNSGVTEIFRQRLADTYGARISQLNTFKTDNPSELLTSVLPNLLNPGINLRALHAPYWLDLSQKNDKSWQIARLDILARLNEQRETLRRNLQQPLVIILPDSERQQVKELIPDLWAIRDFSLIGGNELISVAAVIDRSAPVKDHVSGSSLLSSSDKAILEEWERVTGKNVWDRGVLVAGGAATDVCLRSRSLAKAYDIATENLSIAKHLAKGAKETPESLRDLSVSLNKVGDVAKAQGKLAEAEGIYKQGLAICQDIIKRVGEIPELLRDLSVYLEKVGDVTKGQGNLGEAEEFYKQVLAIRQGLLSRIGGTPESLRDFSISLEKVGDVAKAQGNLGEAEEFYKQSLAISQDIIKRVGETPELLSDLSIMSKKVADIAEKIKMS